MKISDKRIADAVDPISLLTTRERIELVRNELQEQLLTSSNDALEFSRHHVEIYCHALDAALVQPDLANEESAQPVEAVDVDAGRDLVKRLRDTPNWLREAWGDFKSAGANKYDRAPKEAAEYIETLLATLANPRPKGDEFADKAERMLSELVDKIMPGLDTGDLLADAMTASRALDAAPTGEQAGEVVAWLYRDPAEIEFNRKGSITQDAELVRLMREVGGHEIFDLVPASAAPPRPVGVPDGYRLMNADGDRHEALGRAIENACERLPVGWSVTADLERDSGTVRLYDPEGDEVKDDFGGGDYFHEEVENAVAHALSAAPEVPRG